MNRRGYAGGLPPLAWALIIVLIIILVIAFVPQVKNAILDILTAAK